VIIIKLINSSRWALPSIIIFAEKMHQASWYRDIPSDWIIGVSENGWTNDQLSLFWVKEIFYKHTHACAIEKYWLLILDDYKSHITPEFNQFCTQNIIILLYMLFHSSHLLQPLDVGCFAPLKKAYRQKVKKACILASIILINKTSWLYINLHKQKPYPHSISAVDLQLLT